MMSRTASCAASISTAIVIETHITSLRIIAAPRILRTFVLIFR
jgi:hypothetical protein